jgi:ankyrin repeat domain-containing protein 13
MKKRWGVLEFQSACDELRESISSRNFKEVQETEKKSQILKVISQLSQLSNYHIRFFPQEESKTIKRLKKYIPTEIWKQILIRKVIYEFWKGLETLNPFGYVKDRIFRYIYGISESSTDFKDYPLHLSVFNNDLYRIHKLCVGEDQDHIYTDIDKEDALGNTPLMLAVKLKKYEEALVLIDHGADPKYRSTPANITPIEQALGLQDKSMLRILITGYLRIIRERWVSHIEEFVETLENMKDFSMTMRWECKSSIIPFVKRFTPSDVYQIYKRGKNVRIDLTLIAWDSLKSRRGNTSLLFNGKNKKLEIFDHATGINRDFDTEPTENMIESTVLKLIKNKKFSNDVRIHDIEVIPDKNWKGQTQSENINNWICKKNKLKCKIEIDQEKKLISIDRNLDKFKTFEEYFEYANTVNCELSQQSQTIVEPTVRKHYSKKLSASLWTCDYFPLSLKDFLPILDLLSSFSKNVQHLSTFFRHGDITEKGFPVKALIPVYASVKLLVHLDSITLGSPDKGYFSFPKHEELRSNDTTIKLEDWTSDIFYQCDVSCSDDDNLLEAQQLFLSLKSFDSTPLLTYTSLEDIPSIEDEMPEISDLEYHHKLPEPRNSLPSNLFKKNELFKKVKSYAMGHGKGNKNDADVVL